MELEEVVVFHEEDGEKKAIIPILVEDEEGNLATEETPYLASIAQSSTDGITLGASAEESAPSVKFTQIDINEVEAKTEDNKALYTEIYPYVDLLLTTLPQGIKENLILKKPLGYNQTGANLLSGYQGENKWSFDYELELS